MMKIILPLTLLLTASAVFAQDVSLVETISNPLPNRDLAISPDGKVMYSTVQSYNREVSVIVYTEKSDTGWSALQIAPFSGKYADLEPAFSPDGKRLYFASNRPTPERPEKSDYDIWYIEKTDSGWSLPQSLPAIINTEKNEFYPSITSKGHVYYTAAYDDSKGTEDIYVSRFVNGAYQKPENLDEAINSETYEFNAFISPDETYLIFSSFGRADDLGGGDLYISFKDENGKWKSAQHLPANINTTRLDYCPFVDNQGDFYFTSSFAEFPEEIDLNFLSNLSQKTENGLSNIYRVKFDELIKSLNQ